MIGDYVSLIYHIELATKDNADTAMSYIYLHRGWQ